MAKSVRDIRVEGERGALRTVEIREGDGDRSLLTIGPLSIWLYRPRKAAPDAAAQGPR